MPIQGSNQSRGIKSITVHIHLMIRTIYGQNQSKEEISNIGYILLIHRIILSIFNPYVELGKKMVSLVDSYKKTAFD